ncbi:hypothetical protein [uncultured Bacteroides sp.]|jgi:hypothetical protein|uniref:hypothetical protein n=1 Tax=uncultured Bacteroides sp. TaxID=162156 RepID=UPI00280A59B3|nr:hypothetical protein [uncultured Bacteroides sp.]
MKEEDNILKKIGTENAFRVPEGYFENLTSEVMNRLPEKEKPAFEKREVTMWERVKPWVYMTAMFAGAALIIRVASSDPTPAATDRTAADEADTEMEYINMAVDNSMLDDYSLYVYLADSDAE